MSKRWGASDYSHHYIADFIISHFPESFLQEIGDLKKTYEVYHSEKKLLSIDIKGVTYFSQPAIVRIDGVGMELSRDHQKQLLK